MLLLHVACECCKLNVACGASHVAWRMLNAECCMVHAACRARLCDGNSTRHACAHSPDQSPFSHYKCMQARLRAISAPLLAGGGCYGWDSQWWLSCSRLPLTSSSMRSINTASRQSGRATCSLQPATCNMQPATALRDGLTVGRSIQQRSARPPRPALATSAASSCAVAP